MKRTFTTKGLRLLEPVKTAELLADFEFGDIISGGLVPCLLKLNGNPEDPAAKVEATALSNLVAAMLASDCMFGVTFFGKLCLANTEADLLPELENLDWFGDAIYVTIETLYV